MRRSRTFPVLAGAVSLGLAAVACGSLSNTTPSSGGKTTATPTPTTPTTSTPTPSTPTPNPTLAPANISIQLPTPVWQQGILGGPPTVHFEITLVNQGSAPALHVVIRVISHGQPVPVLSQDTFSGCAADTQTNKQIDLAELDPGQGASVLCEPAVGAAALGSAPFYAAVYANGYSTNPFVSARFACVRDSFGGETCNNA
jgi:hypothetical protein